VNTKTNKYLHYNERHIHWRREKKTILNLYETAQISLFEVSTRRIILGPEEQETFYIMKVQVRQG
jgi:hypothetical protein